MFLVLQLFALHTVFLLDYPEYFVVLIHNVGANQQWQKVDRQFPQYL